MAVKLLVNFESRSETPAGDMHLEVQVYEVNHTFKPDHNSKRGRHVN